MAVISVRFNEAEDKIIRQYIESKGENISQYIKTMLLERIEDEYDVSIVNEYLQEKDSMEFLTFEEAAKEWDIK
ncbi:type II toxin-antitoxin system RelB family antitoxin [Veillonella sp. 3627]|uniref:type II toxin-antitoxin system RelB family antitoxin n=1 Tax=Veillonella sp. 3627 TaxID=2490953 RepID=UPI000F8D6FF2|nr:DUF6290 family protein [Veillonella sp. 3627]